MNNSIEVYGIRNCDTVRKALKWLNENQVQTQFHDFKKEPLTTDLVSQWLAQVSPSKLINRRGTTWRKLDESAKNLVKSADLIQLIIENPSLVKRPVVYHQSIWTVGFDEQDWQIRFL